MTRLEDALIQLGKVAAERDDLDAETRRQGSVILTLYARIESLAVERDAAITEGERRATAAIVAFLQREADASVANYADHQCGRMFEAALLDAKCAIERGDPITEAKPSENPENLPPR